MDSLFLENYKLNAGISNWLLQCVKIKPVADDVQIGHVLLNTPLFLIDYLHQLCLFLAKQGLKKNSESCWKFKT